MTVVARALAVLASGEQWEAADVGQPRRRRRPKVGAWLEGPTNALLRQLRSAVGEDQRVRVPVWRCRLQVAEKAEVVGERPEALVREAADCLHEWSERLTPRLVLTENRLEQAVDVVDGPFGRLRQSRRA